MNSRSRKWFLQKPKITYYYIGLKSIKSLIRNDFLVVFTGQKHRRFMNNFVSYYVCSLVLFKNLCLYSEQQSHFSARNHQSSVKIVSKFSYDKIYNSMHLWTILMKLEKVKLISNFEK